MALTVVEISVSVEIADKEYGNGSGRFISLKGACKDALPLADADPVIDDGLDLFLAAWKTLLGARWSQGGMTGDDFKTWLEKSIRKTDKVKEFLRTEGHGPSGAAGGSAS